MATADAHDGSRIPALDGVRGLAVTLVVASHLPPTEQTGRSLTGITHFLNSGWIGVDVFFVLSGFLITDLLLRDKSAPRFFANFYARRCLRIWPLYYAVVLATIALAGASFSTRELAGLLTFTSNFVMVGSGRWIYQHGPINLNHFWSLAIEEQFYLVWPFAVYFLPVDRLKKAVGFLIILSFCARLSVIFDPYRPLAAYLLTLCRFDAIGLGCLCAIIKRDGSASRYASALRFAAVSGACVLLTILVSESGGLANDTWPMLTLGMASVSVIAASAILELGAGSERGMLRAAFENRALRWLGKYSYALYVLHVLVMGVFAYAKVFPFLRALMPEVLAYATYMVLIASLSLVAARLSWTLIESPFLRLKGRFYSYRLGLAGSETA
jgi:peptidoglycan/LPS O-acetylase OafA/YrhL